MSLLQFSTSFVWVSGLFFQAGANLQRRVCNAKSPTWRILLAFGSPAPGRFHPGGMGA